MERGRVESAPKSPSCVWNSPIRLPRSGKLPSSHIARLAVWRHVFRSPCCVLRAACCVLNQSRISGSCASTIARKPLSQGSCLDGLNTALRRRRDILVIDRASGQLTRFDSATLLCDAPRLRNHDAERRATKKPFPFCDRLSWAWGLPTCIAARIVVSDLARCGWNTVFTTRSSRRWHVLDVLLPIHRPVGSLGEYVARLHDTRAKPIDSRTRLFDTVIHILGRAINRTEGIVGRGPDLRFCRTDTINEVGDRQVGLRSLHGIRSRSTVA